VDAIDHRRLTPLLNITGDQDPNVPSSQSREIYYALRRLGREVEWVRYVHGAHRPPDSVSEAIDFEQQRFVAARALGDQPHTLRIGRHGDAAQAARTDPALAGHVDRGTR